VRARRARTDHVGVRRATGRWTEHDVPDLSGRVALVTGANSGIGYETARVLAVHGAHVVLACRNPTRAAEAARRIRGHGASGEVEVLGLDLADLDSVTAATRAFLAHHTRLDLLVNNAGLMCTPRGTTAQGFETQFGVNHLGHFALTAPLLPVMVATPGSRVVVVSSLTQRFGRIDLDDLHQTRRYSPLGAYSQSKLANLLFAFELQARLSAAGAPTIAVAAHPGGANTNLGRTNPGGAFFTAASRVRPYVEGFTQSPAIGALPTVRAAVDPDVVGGEYYGPRGLLQIYGYPVRVGATRKARDRELATRLWAASEALTGADYGVLG
jgi:NAD(P)-dependent dehydrogenase (short-subunit alcohol dehydrogenase family)